MVYLGVLFCLGSVMVFWAFIRVGSVVADYCDQPWCNTVNPVSHTRSELHGKQSVHRWLRRSLSRDTATCSLCFTP